MAKSNEEKPALKKFKVVVREVHTQEYTVEAENKEAAIKVVLDGGGKIDESAFEYSHTLPPNTWTAEEIEPGKENPR